MAPGEAPKRVDDGGDGWRERERVGEGKSDEFETKMQNGGTYGRGGTRRIFGWLR